MDPMVLLMNNLRFVFDDDTVELAEAEQLRLIVAFLLRRQHRTRRPRLIGFVNLARTMIDTEFHRHFRVHRRTFEYLLRLIAPFLVRQGTRGRHPIAPDLQLMMTLWLMGTPDSYRSVCSRFVIGEGTGLRSVRKVTNGIFFYARLFIRWPTAAEAAVSMRAFRATRNFPAVIGAIDGTHIRITKPSQNAVNYINRKGYYSISMQAVCDHRKKFIHCYVGEAGSVHDARVLRKSKLARFFHDQYFPGNSHLLGDKAYRLSKYILTPFKRAGRLSRAEVNFNYCHSSTRMTIERSFGLLKIKERRILEKLPMFRTDLIPRFVMALCVLHNLNIEEDNLPNLPRTVPPHARQAFGDDRQIEGSRKRDFIKATLPICIP